MKNHRIIKRQPDAANLMLKIANQTHYHKQLARQLVEQAKTCEVEPAITLGINDSEISLCTKIHRQQTCYTHSFTHPRLIKRAQQKNQALLRACNNKKKQIESVIDLTAGWGKDSLILAINGFNVSLVEQNRLLASCLQYLLAIAQKDNNQPCYQRMHIHARNSLGFIQDYPEIERDCVYLDPMFPSHKSGAKPAKDLQLLQLITTNLAIEPLFAEALELARYRVVVKRPLHAPPINELKPDIVYPEKTIRFDVYLT